MSSSPNWSVSSEIENMNLALYVLYSTLNKKSIKWGVKLDNLRSEWNYATP